jgi:hypothetical protein
LGYLRLDFAVSVLLIYLIKKINVIILFVKNCLSVFFDPWLVIMEFMIEQMVVLRLGNISFFAHDLPKQKLKERIVYADPFPQSTITKQRRAHPWAGSRRKSSALVPPVGLPLFDARPLERQWFKSLHLYQGQRWEVAIKLQLGEPFDAQVTFAEKLGANPIKQITATTAFTISIAGLSASSWAAFLRSYAIFPAITLRGFLSSSGLLERPITAPSAGPSAGYP